MAKHALAPELGAAATSLTRRQRWWLVGGLALLVLLAYGQTLGMYFWQDDAALVFKMQHPLPNAGSFGEGWFGVGAYKYLATPFIPLYPLFGMNPLPYFAVGLGIYLSLALTVFWFVRRLVQSNRIATSAAVLFGAGYFGSLAIYRLINSYQTNLSVILALVTFGFLIAYYQSRRWAWYVGAVLLFAATLELMLVRSHGLILPVLALELLFFSTHESRPASPAGRRTNHGTPQLTTRNLQLAARSFVSALQQVSFAALRLLPFVLIYKFFYLSEGNQSSGGAITSLYQTYVVEGRWENLVGLAASFGNMLVPDRVITWFSESTGVSIGLTNWSHLLTLGLFLAALAVTVWRLRLKIWPALLAALAGLVWLATNVLVARAQHLWYTDFPLILAGTLGGLAIIYLVWLALSLWRTERVLAIALLFGLVWSVANYFGYFVLYPTSIMTSTSRYVMHSFVATALIWAIVIDRLIVGHAWRATKPTGWPRAVATGLVALVPLWLAIGDQRAWVQQKSIPTQQFYARMQALYPELQLGSLIWYDTKRDAAVEYQFGDFFSVGSMPDETALAIYYGIDRYDLKLAASANNFLGEAFETLRPPELLYTFYYDGQQLHDTTPQTRAALGGQGEPVPVTFDGLMGRPAALVGTSTPVRLEFDLGATVKPASDLVASGPWEGDVAALPDYFRYLESRDLRRRRSTVEVSSEWSGAEREFLVDGNLERGWAAHRTIWPVDGYASATLTLPEPTSLSRVVWHNSHTIRTPTAYTIDTSLDGVTWQMVKQVEAGLERPTGEMVVEDFAPTTVRYLRMRITGTATKEAPGLIELEAVPTEFGSLDLGLAEKLAADPLLGGQDGPSQEALARYLASHASVRVTYQTDRASHSLHDPLTVPLIGQNGHYAVILPASGTQLGEVQIEPPTYLGDVTVERATASFPTLQELDSAGFIERRSKN